MDKYVQFIFTAWKERYNTVTIYVRDTVEDYYTFIHSLNQVLHSCLCNFGQLWLNHITKVVFGWYNIPSKIISMKAASFLVLLFFSTSTINGIERENISSLLEGKNFHFQLDDPCTSELHWTWYLFLWSNPSLELHVMLTEWDFHKSKEEEKQTATEMMQKSWHFQDFHFTWNAILRNIFSQNCKNLWRWEVCQGYISLWSGFGIYSDLA